MKIIATGAIPTRTESQNALQIANDTELGELAASGALQGVARIELQFPKFTDGRAYSQALLLRRRYRFTGDIRATSAVLAEGVDPAAAQRQFDRFSAFYQGDVLEPRPLFARSDEQVAA